MASKTPHTIPTSAPNRPPGAGGKSLKSFPVLPRAADSDDDEDVGLTVSEDDDSSDSDESDDESDDDSSEATPHASPHAGSHVGPQAGPHVGPHVGPHAGPHVGPHAGPHAGSHPGSHAGSHPGSHAGSRAGSRAGSHAAEDEPAHESTRTHDSGRDADAEPDDEAARIKSLADDSPSLLTFLGRDFDSDAEDNNTNAIATTSEEDADDDDHENNNNSNNKNHKNNLNDDEDDDDDDDDDDGPDLDDDAALDALDDSSIEEEEEAAIKAELSRKARRRSIPGPVSLRRLSQSQQARRHHASSDDSDDSDASSASSSSSSSSSWGNEYLEDYFDQPVNPQHAAAQRGGAAESASDDESHLWQYFFSSDEGEDAAFDGFDGAHDDARASGARRAGARPRALTAPKDAAAGGHGGGAPDAARDAAPGPREGEASTDEDMPLRGRGPVPLPAATASGYVPSGDSTDEDDGVPPERKRRRARGTKAIEVLGANSFSTRPPVLGSWRIKGDKNVGIIDGLTTRTLSPPPLRADAGAAYAPSPHAAAQGTPARGGEPVDPFENLGDTPQDSAAPWFEFADSSFDLGATPTRDADAAQAAGFDDVEVSDLDLLELGDYINTTGLSSDDADADADAGDGFELGLDFDAEQPAASARPRAFRSPAVSPYIYRSRFPSRSVPISAFRNRGSPYVHNPAYPSDNQSPAPRRNSRGAGAAARRPSLARDAFMSPARQPRKRVKKMRGTGPRSALAGHAPGPAQTLDDGPYDLLGELIEIGAISPLFDIDQ